MSGYRWAAIVTMCGWVSAAAMVSGQAAPAEGGGNAAQLARGKAAYTEHCAKCHLEDLAGGVEDAPPLTGSAFKNNWETYTAWVLFVQMRDTMPQESAGKLERQMYADILTHILQFNGVPLPGAELVTDDDLKKVIIKGK